VSRRRGHPEAGYSLPELLTAIQAGLLAILFGWLFYSAAIQWSERNRLKGEELLHRAEREYQLHTLSELYSAVIHRSEGMEERYIILRGTQETALLGEGETLEFTDFMESRKGDDIMKRVLIYTTVQGKKRILYRYRGARITERAFNNL